MRLRASITTRITLIFALLSTLVMISIGTIASYSVDAHFAEEDFAEINGKLELMQHAFDKVHTATDMRLLPQRLNDALVGHPALSVVVYETDGRKIYRTANAEFPIDLLVAKPAPYRHDLSQLRKWKFNGHAYRGLTAQMPFALPGHGPVNVAIALDIAHHDRFIWRFQRSLWIYLLSGILFMVAVGWVAARRGLRPIRDFVRVASRISANRLNERIEVGTLPRELIELGESFNDMLQRLQDSFSRLSEFSSDIAHELRTPVSNLMTQSHVLLSQARTLEEYREILYSNIEEYERLWHMIADMLFLAKADNGLIVPHREKMDLGEEIDAVIEYYEALTSEKQVTVIRQGVASFQGDRLMMRRAFSNLLSNAIRYTSSGQEIRVTINENDQWIMLSVDNPGESIPQESLERIFDRFYRVDPSRQRETEGAGLGLAITKSIIDGHGGSIKAETLSGIVRFSICLPKS